MAKKGQYLTVSKWFKVRSMPVAITATATANRHRTNPMNRNGMVFWHYRSRNKWTNDLREVLDHNNQNLHQRHHQRQHRPVKMYGAHTSKIGTILLICILVRK